jgi:VWFA-related protein
MSNEQRAAMLAHWQSRAVLLALLALACVSTCTATCPAAAQGKNEVKNEGSDTPTYRSTVSEVRVTFFATDENNRSLETVTTSDFAVVDNDLVIRNFRSFAHSDETSLDVVALVDLSESVAPRLRVAMSNVLQLIAREQSIPDDNISVVSFAGISSAIVCASDCRTSDSARRLLALGMKSGGATPLYDALIFAADFISHHPRARGPGDVRGDIRSEVRPVVILFSDGDDTISIHSAGEALEAMQAAGALIYSVDLGTTENQSSDQTPNQNKGSIFLQQLSEATGGRYFFFSPRFSKSDGAATVLNAVLDDLRASYVVTYDVPSHQVGFHSLRLFPTHKLNLTFHSRNGYNYEPGGY